MNFFRSLLLVPALLGALATQAWAAEPARLDDAARKRVLAALSAKLSEEYVYPDKARLIVERLKEKEESGAYRPVTHAGQFATVLTADLRHASRDLHLQVFHHATPLPDEDNDPGKATEQERRIRTSFEQENFGIRKVEALPGNIGYIDLRAFAPLAWSKPSIEAAMTLLAHTDALIVDLRNNGGGDPHTVAFMSSYLFDKRTHLNDMAWRRDKRTDQFWTDEQVSGKKFGGTKKIYVLTSRDTFSAAEEFSYNLQQLRRATTIGERTGGGAHPGQEHPLHPHLSVFIPSGRAINPISKTNWEGTGVAPDVRAKAADALRLAERLALKDLLAGATDKEHAQSLARRLKELGN